MLSTTWLAGLLVLVYPATGVSRGQTDTPAPVPAPEGLRAELTTARRLHSPDRPICVRFTLHNSSDQPVDLPLKGPHGPNEGIGLPLELVFGSPDQPALTVSYEGEKPVAVQPPASAESNEQSPTLLRLAPGGSLGAELDLRAYYRALRYSGTYRLDWRPVGGLAGVASLSIVVEPRQDAILVTDKGKITFKLFYDQAPQNVENFLQLAKDGFYDGKSFHRIVPGFLVQGGCPKGDGTGVRADGRLIPAEFHDAPFQLGTLAMARKPSDPNSASCQFFITLARLPDLDGQYTVIGQASDEESLRTLAALAAEPTDRRDRPRKPLVIRSVNLAPAEQPTTIRLELSPRAPAPPASGRAPTDNP